MYLCMYIIFIIHKLFSCGFVLNKINKFQYITILFLLLILFLIQNFHYSIFILHVDKNSIYFFSLISNKFK